VTNDDDDDPATHPELQKKGGGVISKQNANKGVFVLHELVGKGRLMMQPVNGRCWGMPVLTLKQGPNWQIGRSVDGC
jgi:hypothetical protein